MKWALSGLQVTDLHRHFIDHITIPSKQGKGDLHRVEEVFDCWFESGSMPYGQLHYPFENKEFFEGNFPADFVAEGRLLVTGAQDQSCAESCVWKILTIPLPLIQTKGHWC